MSHFWYLWCELLLIDLLNKRLKESFYERRTAPHVGVTDQRLRFGSTQTDPRETSEAVKAVFKTLSADSVVLKCITTPY